MNDYHWDDAMVEEAQEYVTTSTPEDDLYFEEYRAMIERNTDD